MYVRVFDRAGAGLIFDGAGHVEKVAEGVEHAAGDDEAILDKEVAFRGVEALVHGLHYQMRGEVAG